MLCFIVALCGLTSRRPTSSLSAQLQSRTSSKRVLSCLFREVQRSISRLIATPCRRVRPKQNLQRKAAMKRFFKQLHSIALQYAVKQDSWKKYQKEVCRETSLWRFHCQKYNCVLNCTAVLYIIKFQQKEKLEGRAVERTETKKLLCGDFPITIIQDVKNIWKLFQINVQDLRTKQTKHIKTCFNDQRWTTKADMLHVSSWLIVSLAENTRKSHVSSEIACLQDVSSLHLPNEKHIVQHVSELLWMC